MVGTTTSGRRKLTPEQREAIIQSKDLTCFLALDYGISRGTIYKIRREAEARLPQKVWIPTPISKTDLRVPRTKDNAPRHDVSPHEQAEPQGR